MPAGATTTGRWLCRHGRGCRRVRVVLPGRLVRPVRVVVRIRVVGRLEPGDEVGGLGRLVVEIVGRAVDRVVGGREHLWCRSDRPVGGPVRRGLGRCLRRRARGVGVLEEVAEGRRAGGVVAAHDG